MRRDRHICDMRYVISNMHTCMHTCMHTYQGLQVPALSNHNCRTVITLVAMTHIFDSVTVEGPSYTNQTCDSAHLSCYGE